MKTKSLVLIGVLIIALAAMAAPVMAGTTDTQSATVSATLSGSIALSVNTAAVSLGDIKTVGDHTGAESVSVTTNYNGWYVSVRDNGDGQTSGNARTTNLGHMSELTSGSAWGTKYLINPLHVQSAGITTPVTVTTDGDITVDGASDQHFIHSSANNGGSEIAGIPITITQTTDADDSALTAGSYFIKLTLIAGPT